MDLHDFERGLAARTSGLGSPGGRLVAYLRRAEWFLAVGGCAHCGTLSESITRGKWCDCGRTVDPMRLLSDLPMKHLRKPLTAAEAVALMLDSRAL